MEGLAGHYPEGSSVLATFGYSILRTDSWLPTMAVCPMIG